MSEWKKKSLAQLYDEIARLEMPDDRVVSLSARYNVLLKSVEEILRFADLNESDYILDAGCGSGRFLYRIRKKNPRCDVVGLDSSPNMIKRARRRVPNCDYVCGDVLNLPFRKETFTVILCISVLWHIPSESSSLYYNSEVFQEGFKEFYRVLENNGRMMVNTQNPNHLQSILNFLQAFILHKMLRKIKRKGFLTYNISLKKAGKLCTTTGFSQIHILPKGYYPIYIETLVFPFRRKLAERVILKYYDFFDRFEKFARKHPLTWFFAHISILKAHKTPSREGNDNI